MSGIERFHTTDNECTGSEKLPGLQRGVNTTPPRFEAAPDNAHLDNDLKDERSLANRLAAAQKHATTGISNENENTVTDPLKPAQAHGNEPSRGAKIDAEIQWEEEEMLQKKMDYRPALAPLYHKNLRIF